MMNDKDIWKSLCKGDKDAFSELYAQYYSLLFSWGCKWADGDVDFVKDTLHDFFIYLWDKKAKLSTDVYVSNYLLTSFKRSIINELQKTKKNHTALQEYSQIGEEDDFTAIESFTLQFKQVSKALNNLSAAQREVIELRYIYRFSLQQIADKKNSSLRTVYNLMHRALNKLKEEVGLVILLMFWK